MIIQSSGIVKINGKKVNLNNASIMGGDGSASVTTATENEDSDWLGTALAVGGGAVLAVVTREKVKSLNMKKANTLRDELAKKHHRKYATYAGGGKNGKFVAGCAKNGKCAEDDIAEQLGKNANMTSAKGYRRNKITGELEYRDIPVCKRCQSKYSKKQFPKNVNMIKEEHGMSKALSNEELLGKISKISLLFLESEERGRLHSLLMKLVEAYIDELERVSDEIINLIGNNHAGIFYVESYQVIEFLISVLENSIENSVRGICVLSILNNLSYFEPVFYREEYSIKESELKAELKNKLRVYSDENFDKLIKSYK